MLCQFYVLSLHLHIFEIMFVFKCTAILFGNCFIYCFRVTVSAVLSLVGPAHKLISVLPTCKCDMFEEMNLI